MRRPGGKILKWLDKVWPWVAGRVRTSRRRRKLRKICRALDIRPYPWQQEFIMEPAARLDYPEGRATGKTTAVMLKLAVRDPWEESLAILRQDPDYVIFTATRDGELWYRNEYVRLQKRCSAVGFTINPSPWEFSRMGGWVVTPPGYHFNT